METYWLSLYIYSILACTASCNVTQYEIIISINCNVNIVQVWVVKHCNVESSVQSTVINKFICTKIYILHYCDSFLSIWISYRALIPVINFRTIGSKLKVGRPCQDTLYICITIDFWSNEVNCQGEFNTKFHVVSHLEHTLNDVLSPVFLQIANSSLLIFKPPHVYTNCMCTFT